MLKRIAQSSHQSCFVITSPSKPEAIELIARQNQNIRFYEGMNITSVGRITNDRKDSLKVLDAVGNSIGTLYVAWLRPDQDCKSRDRGCRSPVTDVFKLTPQGRIAFNSIFPDRP